MKEVKENIINSGIVKEMTASTSPIFQHFEDKMVDAIENFKYTNPKNGGVTLGYQAERISHPHTFMLKWSCRNLRKASYGGVNKGRFKAMLTAEFMTAPLFKLFLYNRAPIVELITTKSEIIDKKTLETLRMKSINNLNDGEKLFIRSKFFNNFETMSYYKDHYPHLISKITGLEKVVAAALLMLRDYDLKDSNIGVVKGIDEQGEESYTLVKIDHGVACVGSSVSRVSKVWELFWDIGYINKSTVLSFKAELLKEALDGMIEIAEKSDIFNILSNRMHILKDAGMDFSGRLSKYVTMKKVTELPRKYWYTASAISLPQYLTDEILNSIPVLKEFSKTLGVIAKSDLPENIKNRGWLVDNFILEIADQKGKIDGEDPMLWAMKHNIPLRPRVWFCPLIVSEPLRYAIDNKIKIEGEDALTWAIKHDYPTQEYPPCIRLALCEGLKIEGKDPLTWTIENNITIEGKHPVQFAIHKKMMIGMQEAARDAIEHNIKLEGEDALIYVIKNYRKTKELPSFIEMAIGQNLKIEGKDALVWTILNNIPIEEKPPLQWVKDKQRLIGGLDVETWYQIYQLNKDYFNNSHSNYYKTMKYFIVVYNYNLRTCEEHIMEAIFQMIPNASLAIKENIKNRYSYTDICGLLVDLDLNMMTDDKSKSDFIGIINYNILAKVKDMQVKNVLDILLKGLFNKNVPHLLNCVNACIIAEKETSSKNGYLISASTKMDFLAKQFHYAIENIEEIVKPVFDNIPSFKQRLIEQMASVVNQITL